MTTINYGTRARLGVLLPSGNQAAEPQFHAMLPRGVSLHTTRLKLTGTSERELLGMTERIEEAADLVADTGADLILFHCTAVTTFSPALEESIKQRIVKATGKPAIVTSEAIVAALRTLRASRLVMLSPYIKAVNWREEAYFQGLGFEILDSAGLEKLDASAMMSVTPEEWTAFAHTHHNDRADAYLMSCTAVRSTDVADKLERELGRPVVTSNTATVWHCLRRLGISDRIEGYGRLLREY
jgi:maleate isomerase